MLPAGTHRGEASANKPDNPHGSVRDGSHISQQDQRRAAKTERRDRGALLQAPGGRIKRKRRRLKKAEPPKVIDPVTEYAQDVIEGRIPAGPYVRLACHRHISDLTRTS